MDWYNIYWELPDDNQWGVMGKVINRLGRKLIRKRMNVTLPEYYKSHPVQIGINTAEKKRKLVCSLTSFPARIDEIWISIETIFRQTYKADEIILWLSKNQFAGQALPQSILNCQEKGLTIRWVDGDLRSHKKYFYVLQEYKNKNVDVVLLDDDLYYPDRLLENLVSMAHRHPHSICATRVHKMTYNGEGLLNPYRQWIHNYNPKQEMCSGDLFFTSGAGTLIPSGIMPADTFNDEVFKQICFHADDVWLNMHAQKAGISIYTNNKYNKDEISIGHSQDVKLVNENVLSGGNDKQIQAVMEYLNNNLGGGKKHIVLLLPREERRAVA